jgi:nucleoid-associated protein YgaU
VPSTVVANRVWDAIKKVDPTYSDLKHEIGTTGGETQPVTIKSGDTLSAISLLFYGNANKYPQIAQANNIANPNSVPIGTTLQLPVLN